MAEVSIPDESQKSAKVHERFGVALVPEEIKNLSLY